MYKGTEPIFLFRSTRGFLFLVESDLGERGVDVPYDTFRRFHK